MNATHDKLELCLDEKELFWIEIAGKVLNSWFAIFLSLAVLVYSIRLAFKSIVNGQIWKDSKNFRTDVSRTIVKGVREYRAAFPWSHHIVFFISSSAITLFAVWTLQSKIPFLNNQCI